MTAFEACLRIGFQHHARAKWYIGRKGPRVFTRYTKACSKMLYRYRNFPFTPSLFSFTQDVSCRFSCVYEPELILIETN